MKGVIGQYMDHSGPRILSYEMNESGFFNLTEEIYNTVKSETEPIESRMVSIPQELLDETIEALNAAKREKSNA